jgi:hypothetical protein
MSEKSDHDGDRREHEEREHRESATNAAIGEGLSWIAGKDSTKRGTSPTDGAVGSIISWFTGRGDKKKRGKT